MVFMAPRSVRLACSVGFLLLALLAELAWLNVLL
jgi:hypothetical protein